MVQCWIIGDSIYSENVGYMQSTVGLDPRPYYWVLPLLTGGQAGL